MGQDGVGLGQNNLRIDYFNLATGVPLPARLSTSFQRLAQTRTGHQVSTPYPFSAFTALAPPSFPSRCGTSISMNCRSEGSLTVDNSAPTARRWTSKDIRNRCRRQLIIFDMLPDDVLLEIFDFHVDEDMYEDFEPSEKQTIELITLVHVSTLEKCRFSITTSPQSATHLYNQNTCEGHPGHLAAFASHHSRRR
ncbi:hypothetical protein F5888DRAFT_1105901 [Russula emetica]|nr:hypothetical protein F5888DRAFT_1105901 [Russula emetica]